MDEVARACENFGGKGLVVQTHTTQEEQVNILAAEAVAHFGRIDVWVNSAAVPYLVLFKNYQRMISGR